MIPTTEIRPSEGLNWDAAAADYSRFRPTYPAAIFDLLRAIGVGKAGQSILDLGTGTGALAIPFARSGAAVTAVDASPGQLQEARATARAENLRLDFLHALAESTGLPDASFDAITASMSWSYFDAERMSAEVPRLLRLGGTLVILRLLWKKDDPIARLTDQLLAKYNPASASHHDANDAEPVPAWSVGRFRLRTFHSTVASLPFTRESWRGRIRASKWMGAALDEKTAQAFDKEHEALLLGNGLASFSIRHGISVHQFEPVRR